VLDFEDGARTAAFGFERYKAAWLQETKQKQSNNLGHCVARKLGWQLLISFVDESKAFIP
jgi:hypothetical protein